MAARFAVVAVRGGDDLRAVAALFRDYAASLEVDLSYQDFATELAELPGKYAPPAGELLLARAPDGEPLACIGLRPLPFEASCEMKRLYVRPGGRSLGLGTALVAGIVAAARRIGYRDMRLDTLPSMHGAMALYAKTGFTPIEPYYETPVPGTVFLGRKLPPVAARRSR